MITKAMKDLYPKIYGYGSLEQLHADTENELPSWVPFRDADGDLRFIPCTEEYYHWYRNEERNEIRRKETESRCLISSVKYGFVKCRADCSQCSKVRDGHPISIDYMRENYGFEFPDESYELDKERAKEKERSSRLWSLVNDFEGSDQQILKLYNEGKTDSAIAEIVKKSRSMVQERRIKLIEELKEKYKKFSK